MREYRKGNNIISCYPISGSNGWCFWELRTLDRSIITTGICRLNELVEAWR